MVESANKVVVQAHLKGAGMHWQPRHVNPMLTLRSAIQSERWEEAWQAVIQEQQEHRRTQQRQRATARVQKLEASLLHVLLRFFPPTPVAPPPPSLPRLVEPAATLPGSFRPSAHHPWKRGPSCRPRSDTTI